MWIFLISSIASSILGSAANSWFADTKAGIWFYKKVDNVSTWASEKLGLRFYKMNKIGKRNTLMSVVRLASLKPESMN